MRLWHAQLPVKEGENVREKIPMQLDCVKETN